MACFGQREHGHRERGATQRTDAIARVTGGQLRACRAPALEDVEVVAEGHGDGQAVAGGVGYGLARDVINALVQVLANRILKA